MKISRNRKALIAASGVLVAAAIGGGAAIAGGVGDDGADQPITGAALEKAKAAALAYTGGGRVTGTESGDEESLYEVEVKRADGTQVDVQLDQSFQVVQSQAEGPENPADEGQDEQGDD